MNRRHFLEHTLAGAVLPSFLGSFPLAAFGAANPEVGEDNVLVIVQLSGGNDGLNTVIPLDQYSKYKAARGTIAIPDTKVLKLSGVENLGIHPSMTGIQNLYNEGKIRIMNSVGYPSPNFSHFRATDIWNSASDSNQLVTSGWAGRFLGLQNPNFPEGYPNPNAPDPLAIQIGSSISPLLMGPTASMGMAISNVTNFYNLVSGKNDPVPNTNAGKELNYLRGVAVQTNKYAEVIKAAAGKVTKQGTYPATNLANQLKIVAQLIAGGLKTKIYIVNTGGFDTHSGQADTTDPTIGTHANLLAGVSDAIKAFMDDAKGLGVSKRVLGFTFSEFGRRVKANASGGTDHGYAAPMFMFGDRVNPGISGTTPKLPDVAAVADNVDMQFDFRMVYQSILENWFCQTTKDATAVMLKDFTTQPIIDPTACGRVTAVEPKPLSEVLVNYPNPFKDFTHLTFQSKGGNVSVEVIDIQGNIKAVPVDAYYPKGQHEVIFNGEHLPSGTYFARFRNDDVTQIRKMMKV